MVNEGIVLGQKISEPDIEVDKAKVDAIEKMPCPKDIKGIRSFLGHAGFYRRFTKDLSKISRHLTYLLQKDVTLKTSLKYYCYLLLVTNYLAVKLHVTYNFSACRNYLAESTCHFLLLLIGFGTLTY